MTKYEDWLTGIRKMALLSEKEKDHLKRRNELIGIVHAATDAVHRITGRTDQTPADIVALFPDHPDVKAFLAAQERLKGHDTPT